MAKKDPAAPKWLTDLMNGASALIMILVGILLLGDGLSDREIPFLLIGLLLVVIGTFQTAYRANKGKWVRLFGGRNGDR